MIIVILLASFGLIVADAIDINAAHKHHDDHGIVEAPKHCTPGKYGETCPDSWDQANLKKNDSGCPTAIFTAPHGVLVQCL